MFSHTFGSSSDAGKSRLSQTRMFTLETLKFKEVMNKQRMNGTQLLLYLWLFLSLDSTCSVCFRPGKSLMRKMNVLTNLQTTNKTDSVQHCMQLFMMLLLELINFKLQKNFSVKRWSVNLKLAAEDQ